MKLLIFAASHRKDSLNRILARLIASHAKAQNIEVDLVEYDAFDMPVYNDETARGKLPEAAYSFANHAAKADGIVICSPEYNWSYPGSLKNIIDWTSRISPNPVAGKTALLMSATPGSRGGIVGLQHLKIPLEAVKLFVFPKVFALGSAASAFDASGKLTDSKQHGLFISIVNDYIDFTKKLRP